MKLRRVKLENFKKISNCEIDLAPSVNTFIGRNNSGKTSFLNAIYSCVAPGVEVGTQINRSMRDGLAKLQLSFSFSKAEWALLTRISGIQGPPLLDDQCTQFEAMEVIKKREWRYVDGRLVENPQSLQSPDLQKLNTPDSNTAVESLGRVANSNIASIFGIVPLSTAGRRLGQNVSFVPYNNLRQQGYPLESFNSWLYHLKRKNPQKYQEFIYEVKSVFPEIDTLDVDYDQDSGNVDVKVIEEGAISQGTEMGSGWHSMLALYSHMLFPGFTVLLLDEPDAHMHASLVRLLAKFLTQMSASLQIIIATHNPAFINSLPLSTMWHFEDLGDGISELKRTETSGDLAKLLHDLGIEIPNEVMPVISTFEKTKAAQTLVDGVDSRLDLKKQILETSKSQIQSYYSSVEPAQFERDLTVGTHAYRLARELQACPKGRESFSRYQHICAEILSYALSPPLATPVQQSLTGGGEQRRDLVIHIPYGIGGFWNWVMFEHDTIAVVAECKNHSEPISSAEVTVTSKYFGERRLGKFGLIITRTGVDEGAQEEIKRLWTEPGSRIVIIPLKDEDLVSMLKIKEGGGRPEIVIDMHYRKFREQLAR